MQNFKWQISKQLKTAMRQKNIDNFSLVDLVGALYDEAHPGHSEDMRAEVFAILDEYNPNLDIEIFDMVCRALGIKITLG
ncbi:hypothetical protein OFO03_06480 [Campylobacter sp. JMF_02 ED1]|uniref:hypothetical protein n=1 Tax=unclassified Campylobacter TaxID=2593542 RepID=UPI0022E9E939|nr:MULTISPECIES: hypothetical protein [unclassified Campylobacter]MDA3047618.1 hypothetical protein [Campylobacter sp. JMF_08 NE1]MDA3049032.1 hypothetical protein [Campylobacter sp. JMF_15 NE4]MDA3051543.1 hypothetical protein [Campylobacter sp. JMF_02 ED1]MDA3076669.1 hypothetical protein [Campylobacter sp. JMF_04 NA10]